MNKYPILGNGKIHSPYFIFIECGDYYSDQQVLDLIGASEYRKKEPPTRSEKGLYITNDGKWTHILDTFFYLLWHSEQVRDHIEELSKKHNIYSCSVGDSDHSFDFIYYRGGNLFRHYVYDQIFDQPGKVTKNLGAELLGEKASLLEADETSKVLAIAESLGIDTNYENHELRYYGK